MNQKIHYELKPCPFCGGQAYLERNSRAFMYGKSTRVAYVRCVDCEARSGKYDVADYGHTSKSQEAERAAVDQWNMRCENGC